MEMKRLLLPESLSGNLIQLAVGALLVITGFVTWPDRGVRSEPEPPAEMREVGPAPLVEKRDPDAYRLRYSAARGHWTVKPSGSRERTLTDIVPGPRGEEPKGWMTREEIRDYLLQTCADWDLELRESMVTELSSLELGGQRLFSGAHFANGRAQVPKQAKPPVTQTTEPIETGATSTPVAPVWLDPTHPEFAAIMRTWRDEKVLILARAAVGTPGTINFNIELDGDTRLRVGFAEGARKRLLADGYGSRPIDAGIYLQYRVNLAGRPLSVDGQLGPGSREAIVEVLSQQREWAPHAARYAAILADYCGREIPDRLRPGTRLFTDEMKAWHARISPLSGSSRITFTPDFSADTVTLTINDRVAARLAAADFGSRQSDAGIYLQATANRFGQSLIVDGQIGPGSRRALGEVLATTFRRPNARGAYSGLLQKAF